MQAGHYMSRRHKSTIYDLDNIQVQCYSCNCMLHGNLIVYRRWMDNEYGPEQVEDLERRAKQSKKWTTGELEELYNYYKSENEKLLESSVYN